MRLPALTRPGLLSVALLVVALLPPSAAGAAPDNDNFADAATIESLPYETEIDVTKATREPEDGAVSCHGTFAGYPVWYRYEPRRDEHAVVRLQGQDAFVAIYEGRQRDALSKIGCLDSWEDSSTVVSLDGTSTYFFAVGNYYESIDPHIWFRVEEATAFDVAITSLDVETSGVAGGEQIVHVEATNTTDSATTAAMTRIVIVARPRTMGNCSVIASDPFALQPHSTIVRSYRWLALIGAGSFEITAEIVVREAFDTNVSNNHRSVEHDVMIDDSGYGLAAPLVNAC